MNAIIARPAAGATPAPSRAKAAPRPAPAVAPVRSEADTLALQAAEILQSLAVSVIYDEKDDPRKGFDGPHADDVDHYLLRLLSPETQERDGADPAEGDILGHLALISSNLKYMIEVADREEANGIAKGVLTQRIVFRGVLEHACDFAERLFIAYKNLPESLEDLRALTTYAGARPFRDRPQPPVRRVDVSHDALHTQLEIAKSAASLLAHNFFGDGDFADPSHAPSIREMVALTSTALVAAEQLGRKLQLSKQELSLISQPRGWAEHMTGLANTELFSGDRGFRVGDQLVGLSFWDIEKLAQAAFDNLTKDAA